ncbi:MAG: allantoinase AllB [Solirubrobacteraceae bacterium]|nr:allantoinase AllB [Solirubrobacteraceae bacterium]
MSDADLVVRGGFVVTPDGVGCADVVVREGIVVEVTPSASARAVTEIDATGLHVFPGLIDSHVHFDEPGRTEWEGISSGTAACAAGGVTTFIDMPLNSTPPLTDVAAFDAKHAAAARSALVDFGFWAGLVPGALSSLPTLAQRGAVGFKAFSCDSGIDDFARADDLTLLEGMGRCAELGLPVLLHAENAEIVQGLGARARAKGRRGVRDFAASRPAIAEVEAIARALLFAEETGCALHIVHISTAAGVRLVSDARRRGVDASCETCPHYLLFTEEDMDRLGILVKSAPPPRTAADRDALWEGIADGSVAMVVSDHSPGPPEMKVGEDYFAMWGGVSGCQSTLGLLLAHGHAKRGLALETIAAVTAGNIAERFGLPGKGAVAAGNHADLVLVDLTSEGIVGADELLYRHPTSCFVGSARKGRIARTLVRGRTVFADGRVVGSAAGRLVVPRRAGPAPGGSTGAE